MIGLCPYCGCHGIVPDTAVYFTEKYGLNRFYVKCKFCESVASVQLKRVVEIVEIKKSNRKEPNIG
jgi:hypothetical protein